jgi:hypothetical protein
VSDPEYRKYFSILKGKIDDKLKSNVIFSAFDSFNNRNALIIPFKLGLSWLIIFFIYQENNQNYKKIQLKYAHFKYKADDLYWMICSTMTMY